MLLIKQSLCHFSQNPQYFIKPFVNSRLKIQEYFQLL